MARVRLFQHTNLAGDNYVYQDDVGIVTVDTKFPGGTEFTPNPNVLIEYEDIAPPSHPEFPGEAFITIDFDAQQINDLLFVNKMYPLPNT